jgi:hypothetical protein
LCVAAHATRISAAPNAASSGSFKRLPLNDEADEREGKRREELI